jgi:hypothetical protein
MDKNDYQAHFSEFIPQWREWIQTHRLHGIFEIALDVLAPLGTLAAQLLYVGQPTARLLLPDNNLDYWARLLDAPDGVEWLRGQLTEMDKRDGE